MTWSKGTTTTTTAEGATDSELWVAFCFLFKKLSVQHFRSLLKDREGEREREREREIIFLNKFCLLKLTNFSFRYWQIGYGYAFKCRVLGDQTPCPPRNLPITKCRLTCQFGLCTHRFLAEPTCFALSVRRRIVRLYAARGAATLPTSRTQRSLRLT